MTVSSDQGTERQGSPLSGMTLVLTAAFVGFVVLLGLTILAIAML